MMKLKINRMKNRKRFPVFIGFVILALVMGCSKDDDGNGSGNGTGDEVRMSTYSFTFEGGDLDGQTISGTFPNDGFHGGGSFIDAANSNSSFDEVDIHIGAEDENGLSKGINGSFLLDADGEVLPVGLFPYDKLTQTAWAVMLEAGDDQTFMYASMSGTAWVSNLVVGPNLGGTAYADYDAGFDAVFHLSGDPDMEEIGIVGSFEIRSIRD